MTFLIITHVLHKKHDGKYFAYGPYVKEMNSWLKYPDKVLIVAPQNKDSQPSPIDLHYLHTQLELLVIPSISFTSFIESIISLTKLPRILIIMILAMIKSDHIHLRCPGNIGLLGSIAQIFFPSKRKTAKYAGNWDWNSKQPWSYRLQQILLNNHLISRNMSVLVYGDWPCSTSNIVPFFTASYHAYELEAVTPRLVAFDIPINLIFVGSLTESKNPILAVEICRILNEKGVKVSLNLYGEGKSRYSIEKYIQTNLLEEIVTLHGACNAETIKQAYKRAHFLILASRSEGWPKVVAEAMSWGCLPVVTPVSCVSEMIGNGSRGILCSSNPKMVSDQIITHLNNPTIYNLKTTEAMTWARKYTLEYFENNLKSFFYE